MSIDIEKVEPFTMTTVRVHLSGAPDVKADYLDRYIQPYFVAIEYVYHQTVGEDGWTNHNWNCWSATVVGFRVLKPSKDGTRRLGDATHRAGWSGYGRDGIKADNPRKPLPEWLDKLITELRPSGNLDLPGV